MLVKRGLHQSGGRVIVPMPKTTRISLLIQRFLGKGVKFGEASTVPVLWNVSRVPAAVCLL